MITSVVSSAARLSLAPARLAGRLAGSLLGELRGNGAGDAGPARSPGRAKPAARSGANARRKRDASVASARPRPKRGAGGSRSKAQSKRPTTRTRAKAQSRRPATRTRASSRPKPEPKPLDDVTIARKVESNIFRDIDVDKGKVDVNVAERVVWLRGEVANQDLITELEARATGVTEVRRVENLLHVPEAPAPGRTDTAALQADAEDSSSRRPETLSVGAAESSEEAAPPVSGIGTGTVEGDDTGDEPTPTRDAAAPSVRGEESTGSGRADEVALDQAVDRDESIGREASEAAEADQGPEGDESPEHGPGVVGLGKDSAYQVSVQRGPGGD
jgi:osmotically-inducible protein OsmY